MSTAEMEAGLAYLREHREIRDVLLSGGDPLMLPIDQLASILASLRAIDHIEIIRIGTRVPGAAPHRITRNLAMLLGRHAPLYINIHFNHPLEITAEAMGACTRLADAGIPLGSQTVLLRDVNDDPEVLADLFKRLLRLRARPHISGRRSPPVCTSSALSGITSQGWPFLSWCWICPAAMAKSH